MKTLSFSRTGLLATILLTIFCLLTAAVLFSMQWDLPFSSLLSPAGGLPLGDFVFAYSTLPRMAVACLAGGILGAVSSLLQQVMRNPLASDSTLAVSAGAQTAVVAATVFAPALLIWGNGVTAFAGALAALLCVLALSRKRRFDLLMVILAGMVVSLYLGAVSAVLVLFNSEQMSGVLLWGAGMLTQDSWHNTLVLLANVAVAAVLLGILRRPLNMLVLDDGQAASLGLPVRQIRLGALIAAAWLSAVVISMVGMMGFVGLAAASVAREAGVRTPAGRFLMSFVLGALMLCGTDNVLQLISIRYGIDIPAGAVTAVIGAPLLLWLMTRTRPQRIASEGGSMPGAVKIRRQDMLLPAVMLLAAAAAVSLLVSHNGHGWSAGFLAEVMPYRVPRLLGAAAAGVLLASAGVILQRLTHNPMAGPELLGISAGTALGVMVAVLLFNVVIGSTVFWMAGIASAVAALLLVVVLNGKSKMQPDKILLTGIALAALADAFIRLWSAGGDPRTYQMLTWLSGSTYGVDYGTALPLTAAAVVMTGLTLCTSRWLELLGLGAQVASSAGVRVGAARLGLIVLAGVMTASATLTVGPLSFVGLLAPHMAAMTGSRRPLRQLLSAAVLGAALMILADWLGRQLVFPYEIPAGLMATLIGGAYFLLLMRKL